MSIIRDAQEARRILQIVADKTKEDVRVPYIRAFMAGLRKVGITMEEYKELQKKDYLERNLTL